MSQSPFVPPAITEFMDSIDLIVGQRPNLVSSAPRRWEVRLEGEYVLATCRVHQRAMDGKVQFRSGVLEIDGTSQRTARTLTELASIWKRYELGQVAEIPELPKWTGPMDQVPTAVRKVYEKLIDSHLDESGDPVYHPVLAFQDGRWYVGADTIDDEPGCIRVAYDNPEGASASVWMPNPVHSMVVRNGIRTEVASIAELTRVLTEMVNAHRARPASSNSGPVRQGSTATPGKSNSVATRRASVIRV